MNRTKRVIEKDTVVTATLLETRYGAIIDAVNQLSGPEVAWDPLRNCYGLRARQAYRPGEVITTYGGRRSLTPIRGDYVARCSELHIDGRTDFRLSEKGRWINESCRDRLIVNATLGRQVRALTPIQAGEWIFVDYGEEYQRSY